MTATPRSLNDILGEEELTGERFVPAPWVLADPASIARSRPGPPNMLTRTDGLGLLYQGQLNVLYGEPESGKSWLAILACIEEMEAGNHVFYLDFEADAASMLQRLEILGVDPELRQEFFHYADANQLDRPLTKELWQENVAPQIEQYSPTLTVIDGVTEAMALFGQDPKDDVGTTGFSNVAVRPWLKLGITVLQVDHVPKNANNSRFAFGSQHKKAQVKGAMLEVKVTDANRFGVGRNGVIDVVVTKDNNGYLRGQAGVGGTVAQVSVVAHSDGTLAMTINPSLSGAEAAALADDNVAGRILEFLAEHPDQTFSKRDLESRIRGDAKRIRAVVDDLAAKQQVARVKAGANWRIKHIPEPEEL